MPDIRTALENALAKTKAHMDIPPAWDDEGPDTKPIVEVTTHTSTPQEKPTMPKQLFKPTNNGSRLTFYTVKDNPGTTTTKIADMLEVQGVPRKSVTSLISQMVRQQMMRRVGDGLFVCQEEYTPLKAYKPLGNAVPPAKTKAEKKTSAKGITALVPTTPAPTPAPTAAVPQINSAWDAEVLLNHLSIKQARALYDALRTIFGG